MMKKLITQCLMVALFGLMTACVHDIGTPCPHFGKWCSKTPVNTWYQEKVS